MHGPQFLVLNDLRTDKTTPTTIANDMSGKMLGWIMTSNTSGERVLTWYDPNVFFSNQSGADARGCYSALNEYNIIGDISDNFGEIPSTQSDFSTHHLIFGAPQKISYYGMCWDFYPIHLYSYKSNSIALVCDFYINTYEIKNKLGNDFYSSTNIMGMRGKTTQNMDASVTNTAQSSINSHSCYKMHLDIGTGEMPDGHIMTLAVMRSPDTEFFEPIPAPYLAANLFGVGNAPIYVHFYKAIASTMEVNGFGFNTELSLNTDEGVYLTTGSTGGTGGTSS